MQDNQIEPVFFAARPLWLQGRCRLGANVIAIEVAGYNANSCYSLILPEYRFDRFVPSMPERNIIV